MKLHSVGQIDTTQFPEAGLRRTRALHFWTLTTGAQHSFPPRIDHLVTVATGLLGDFQSIVFDKTILPFFLHFMGKARAESALRALREAVMRVEISTRPVTSQCEANHLSTRSPQITALAEFPAHVLRVVNIRTPALLLNNCRNE